MNSVATTKEPSGNYNAPERERDCWKSGRERERRKARHLIRARVVENGPSENGGGGSEIVSPGTASDTNTVHGDKRSKIVSEYLSYVLHKDRSKFSTAAINRHVEILSQPHNIRLYILEDAIMKDQTIQLFQSWFGLEKADNLWKYLETLSTFTFMELAVWCGKYSIVAALLYGGINPCIRSRPKNDDGATGNNGDLGNIAICDFQQLGSRVLKRFFDRFPLRLSTYIVKRVIDMRRDANQQSTPERSDKFTKCSICKKLIRSTYTLRFVPCGHVFCEPCFWNDVLQAIDCPSKLAADDVVSCLVCGMSAETRTNDDEEEKNSFDKIAFGDLTPAEKRRESLRRLHRLPLNSKTLKWSDGRKRKKKASERDYLTSNWNAAVLPSLGSTQNVRRDKFTMFLEHNSLPYVNACLQYGVDIDGKNEYGQTALYIAVWRGYQNLAKILLEHGADASVIAHGGSTIRSVATAHEYVEILDLIDQHNSLDDEQQSASRFSPQQLESLSLRINSELSLTSLIPQSRDHPGAGSFIIDNALSTETVETLLKLFQSLPVEANQKQKKNVASCSDRSYFCDAEGYVRQLLENILRAATKKNWRDTDTFTSPVDTKVYPHMRFLNYTQPGTVLAPHIDLCRVDPFNSNDNQQQQRSTHTFILYLTDCYEGGETCLLEDVAGEGREMMLAKIAPRRGRLLVFPHATPHEGLQVVDVPKILLRGEVHILTTCND